MARTRPIETYYTKSATRRACVLLLGYDAKGRAVTEMGAVMAATRRVLLGEWARCDVYLIDGRHAYTVRRVGRHVDIQRCISRKPE